MKKAAVEGEEEEEVDPEDTIPILATASSSDGHIKLWKLDPRPDSYPFLKKNFSCLSYFNRSVKYQYWLISGSSRGSQYPSPLRSYVASSTPSRLGFDSR